jgi:hypothetical protein
MDQLLESSRNTLVGFNRNAEKIGYPESVRDPAWTGERPPSRVEEDRPNLFDLGNEAISQPIEFELFDTDLQRLLGAETNEDLRRWLEECVPCSSRIAFRWQMQPIQIIKPVLDLVDDLGAQLDGLEMRFRSRNLDGFCRLLNALRRVCIPDIVTMISSLTFLMRQYASQCMDINIDWTVVLGPILKGILDALSGLVANIDTVLVSSLDCALAELASFAALENTTRALIGTTQAVAQQYREAGEALLDGLPLPGVTVEEYDRQVRLTPHDPGDYPRPPETPRINSIRRVRPYTSSYDATEFFSGISARGNTSLSEAFNNPFFGDATFLEKLILPVREAKDFLQGLLDNLRYSLESAQTLVSGTLRLQLGNYGIILLLTDLIGMLAAIIRLIASNRNVTDWCSELNANPTLLENAVAPWLGVVDIENSGGDLIVRRGSEVTGVVRTCSGGASAVDNAVLERWIADLERR